MAGACWWKNGRGRRGVEERVRGGDWWREGGGGVIGEGRGRGAEGVEVVHGGCGFRRRVEEVRGLGRMSGNGVG